MSFFYESVSKTIDGIKIIFNNTLNFFTSAYTKIALTLGVLKDIITLDTKGASNRVALSRVESMAADKTKKNIQEIADVRQYAASVAADASTKSIDQQKKELGGYKALKEESFKAYDAILRAGKQNTAEGKRSALQLARDAEVVRQVQKSIAAGQDKRKLGLNSDNEKSGGAKSSASGKKTDLDKLKDEAAQFEKDMLALRKQAELGQLSADDAEIQRVTEKFDELKAKALKYYNAAITTAQEYNARKAELDKLGMGEFVKLWEQRAERTANNEYAQQLKYTADFYDHERNLSGQNYAAGLTSRQEYETALNNIDSRETEQRINTAIDYKDTVKQAATDLVKFKADAEKKTTKDLTDEAEKRKQAEKDESDAGKKLAILNLKDGSKARLVETKKQMQKEFDARFKGQEGTNVYEVAHKDLLASFTKMDEDYNKGQKERALKLIDDIREGIAQFQTAMDSLNQFITNRENNQLARDKKINDQKKKLYKDQLDKKLISQQQYDIKVNKLDEEQKKKETEAKRKQAQREKALGIFNVVVNTAAAVAKTFVQFGFPIGVPFAAAMAAIGALQIAAIANTPLPELGTGDWVRKGAKHSDKEGGIPVMIERDEAVMKADAMTNPGVYTVSGTTAQITSALNSRAGGISWAAGASMDVPRWRKERPASINPNMPRIMEQGGVVRSLQGTSTENNLGQITSLVKQLIAEQQQNTEEIKNMKTNLKAFVVIKDIDTTIKDYQTAKNASGLIQGQSTKATGLNI